MDDAFYGPVQAAIHHEAFGRLAERAADRLLLSSPTPASGPAGSWISCGSGILAGG
jgi:hypothetical protein